MLYLKVCLVRTAFLHLKGILGTERLKRNVVFGKLGFTGPLCDISAEKRNPHSLLLEAFKLCQLTSKQSHSYPLMFKGYYPDDPS